MRYLAADIGGTAVKCGLISEEGHVLLKTEAPVDFDQYQTPILESALRTAEKLLREACGGDAAENTSAPELAKRLEIGGIGICAKGMIDKTNGVVAGSGGHLPGYVGSRFKEAFEERFALETRVINDANSAAVAEMWTGRAAGCRNAVVVTIGTGIGGGIIADGRILEGGRGFAGEIGHMTIQKDGPLSSCGNPGTFEDYASTGALRRRVCEALTAAGKKTENISGREIFALAEEGDKLIRSVIREWISDIAVGLVNLVYVFDPEIIVIGGGVSHQKKWLLDPLRETVKERLLPLYAERFRLEPAVHENDAGMIGAVYSFCPAGQKN